MLLPGKNAAKWKLNAAEVLCRALGGDVTLCSEIASRLANDNDDRLAMRTAPEGGWTPLDDMDFAIEYNEDPESGVVYVAGAPEVPMIKVGSWTGTEAALLSRYKTYYGSHTWVRAFASDNCRRDERAALLALSSHHLSGELFRAEAEAEAVRIIQRITQHSL